MKKTLVAVAAMAAFAGAHAEVTMSGVFEAAVSNTGGTSSMIGGTNGSEINFSVTEDLGNGLKAIANTALLHSLTDGNGGAGAGGAASTHGGSSTTSGSNTNTYNSYVGLTGDFGTLKLGQQFSPTFLVSAVGDVNGRSGISTYLAGGSSGQVANSATYTTPSLSGVSVSYQQVLDSSVDSFSSWSINYATGGFSAGYASALIAGVSESVIGLNYDFGVAKIHAGYATLTDEKSSTAFGIAIPFGAFVATYSTSTGYNALSTTASTGDSETKNMVQVTYNLSKRTNAYYAYTNNVTASTTTNIFGVRHNF